MKSMKSPPSPSPQKSPARRTPTKAAPPDVEPSEELKTPRLSIREEIALMRAKKAAASKAAPKSTGLDTFEGLEDALPDVKQEEENVDLGRWSVKETIERARSTGEY